MSVWVTVDDAAVYAAMPIDLRITYDVQLVEYPWKVGRLAVVTAGVVAEFRTALEREGSEAMDADAAKLPVRCAGHAAVLGWFHMAVEIGWDMTGSGGTEIRLDLSGAATDSDPRLEVAVARQFLEDLKAGKGPVGTPRFKSRADRLAERAAAAE